jgi:hypothetical protein
MPAEAGVTRKGSWWSFWPCFVAGLVGPWFGNVLTRWMPAYWATGVAASTVWFLVGAILMRGIKPRFGIPRWLAPILIGAGAGLSAALLSYYFPLGKCCS